MKILKYRLSGAERQTIEMPVGATILSVQVQHESICIWAEVEDYTSAGRTFRIVGTGNEVPEQCKYVGTVQQEPFVWHIYEERP